GLVFLLADSLLVRLARLGILLVPLESRAALPHGLRVALGGGLLPPLARLGPVLRHAAITPHVHVAEVYHGAHVALVSGLLQRRLVKPINKPPRLIRQRLGRMLIGPLSLPLRLPHLFNIATLVPFFS